MPNPLLVLPNSSIFVSSDYTIPACIPNSLLSWGWCITVHWETWSPQNAIFCKSMNVILLCKFFAFSSLCVEAKYTRVLLGRFTIPPIVLNLLGRGYTLLFCSTVQSCATWYMKINTRLSCLISVFDIFLHGDEWLREFGLCITSHLYPSKRGIHGWPLK